MFVLKSKYKKVVDSLEHSKNKIKELEKQCLEFREINKNICIRENELLEKLEGRKSALERSIQDNLKFIDQNQALELGVIECKETYEILESKLKKEARNNKDNKKLNVQLRKQLESSTLDGLDIPNKLKLSKLELMTLQEAYEPNVQGFYVNFVDRLANQLQKNFPDLDINKFKEDCYSE